jgi:hypothetical protein
MRVPIRRRCETRLPDADKKIAFDRFHLAKHLAEAAGEKRCGRRATTG